MAYYTIAHLIRDIPAELLTSEVFDYIFLGCERENLPMRDKLDELRAEFLYWYPYDFRFSAKDLISNHLTFQIFHHVAIFPKECLPKGMVVFGMGLLNGAKMSSSKGNVFLLEDALDEFGADTVRMFLVGSAEPWQDFDWRNELVASTRKQIERFYNTVREAVPASGEPFEIDSWLISRLQRHAGGGRCLDHFRPGRPEGAFRTSKTRSGTPAPSGGRSSTCTLCPTGSDSWPCSSPLPRTWKKGRNCLLAMACPDDNLTDLISGRRRTTFQDYRGYRARKAHPDHPLGYHNMYRPTLEKRGLQCDRLLE
jgi:hypothetical protein